MISNNKLIKMMIKINNKKCKKMSNKYDIHILNKFLIIQQ